MSYRSYIGGSLNGGRTEPDDRSVLDPGTNVESGAVETNRVGDKRPVAADFNRVAVT